MSKKNLKSKYNKKLLTQKYIQSRIKKLGFAFFFLLIFYIFFIFGNFISPYGHQALGNQYINQPPDSFKFSNLTFLQKGPEYKLLNIWKSNLHLIGFSEKTFILGTDHKGRDLFGLIFYSGFITLNLALIAAFTAAILAWILISFVNIFSGLGSYYKKLESLARPVPDILFLFTLVLIFNMLFPVLNYWVLTVLFAIFGCFKITSKVNSQIKTISEKESVKFAKFNGAGSSYIFKNHIVLQIKRKFLSETFSFVALAVSFEILLSFLFTDHLQGSYVSWGTVLKQSFAQDLFRPWQAINISVIALLTIWLLNLISKKVMIRK